MIFRMARGLKALGGRMTADLEDMPVTVQLAAEWSTLPRQDEVGLFDDDPEIAERVRSMAAAIIDCELLGNKKILKDLLTVMGAVPPHVHCPILLQLGQKDPGSVSRAFRELVQGDTAQRFAYRSLIETMGRFSRHGLLVDVMGDEDVLEDVRAAVRRAQGDTYYE